ncbi:hypothetical protein SK128_009688 [Halocaridina rubra]|uniref:Uncharacterized protein n=1 Tax=Halocaridina rubra TaxID=373956 RepID=A0AAN8WG57_HALRR
MQGNLNQDDSSQNILKRDETHSGRLDVDEKDPDIIPENRGSRADLTECGVVADVSTLYGEIMGSNVQNTLIVPRDESLLPPPIPSHNKADIYVDSSYLTHDPHKSLDTHTEPQHFALNTQYAQQEQSYLPPPPRLTSPLTIDVQHNVCFHPSGAPAANTHIAPAPTYSFAQTIPVSHTQTLPRPRSSNQPKFGHNAQPVQLQRRRSLYMDTINTPLSLSIPPPVAYGSPLVTSMTSDLVQVVPLVSETVCIMPKTPLIRSHMNPPENYLSKPFPSSFASTEHLESEV